jgi:hypothetical protein
MKNWPILFAMLAALVFSSVWLSCGYALAQQGDELGEIELEFPTEEFDFGPGQPPMSDEAAAVVAGVMVIAVLVGVVVGVAITILIILLISGALKTVPQEYREMEPGMVWLLLIPVFNLIWNFFVFPRVSKSFEKYFEAQGRTEFGDCGGKIGLWYAICVACCIVPCLNYIAGPASLVLLIIYLVKVLGLKKFVTA